MDKIYEPKQNEEKIYKLWEESGFFNPDNLKNRKKKYVVMIPPPNVTGSLHMGHALDNTIQDLLIRFKRMQGFQTLWMPGTDHAGIATQNVVEKQLIKEGTNRHRLGREKFIERVWQWVKEYGDLIIGQLKLLGCSCDWSRQRFTLDEKYSQAVFEAFVNYWKKGYIYKGPRIVNWCPRCNSAISDLEVKYKPEKTKLWYIKYPYEDGSGYVTVATTRPETMLGDTAVAINPNDERYKNLLDKVIILPIINRKIKFVTDHKIDMTFGTGAVKITPAHDKVDWQIGKTNKLDVINVIGQDAKMTKEAGKDFEGLTTIEAREKIVKLLEQQGLLDKIEDYEHSVGYCDRCGTTIEPIISEQWFVRMEELIKPAIKAVESGKIKVVPERYHDILINWMENIEDWCISRQLWWGHRLPVWFCENQTERISNDQLLISKQIPNSKFQILNSNDYIVSTVKPEKCPFCGHCQMRQSDDVLDTWFSSALWPFATLGWPEKTKDLKEFYPTSFLTTAKDIIFLWVARMIFSSLEFMKEIPFETVYIHATILNVEGRRMSKSLGTGIDPLELINKYGSDATRFGLMYMTNRDQQAIKFDEQTILACRNFINKLWNIARFIEMNIDNNANLPKTKIKPITLADEWILSRLNEIIGEVTKNIDNCEFGEAGHKIYDFVWHEFADWYLEIGKIQVAEDATPETKANTLTILKYLLKNILRLIHPFAPFVTETIYQNLKDKINLEKSENLLMINKWPEIENKFINKKSVADFEKLKNIIVGIRNYRTTNKIENNKILNISTEDKNILEYAKIINKLAKVNITPEAAGQTKEEIKIENIKFKIQE